MCTTDDWLNTNNRLGSSAEKDWRAARIGRKTQPPCVSVCFCWPSPSFCSLLARLIRGITRKEENRGRLRHDSGGVFYEIR